MILFQQHNLKVSKLSHSILNNQSYSYHVDIINKMGFEEAIPPVPDRLAQLKGIQKLEDSWLNQPYYKYYMNESLRQPKLQYSERINKSYRQFWRYFCLSSLALIPVSLLCRRFFVYRGGLPVTYKPDYFQKVRPDNQIRTSRYLKTIIPAHLFAATVLGISFTNWDDVFSDFKLEFFQKPPVMM